MHSIRQSQEGVGSRTARHKRKSTRSIEECENLIPDKAKMFHNLVAKTLYTTKWASPDTCTEVALLVTRFIEPYKYDWVKIVHLMKYIRGERYLPLILRANCSGFLMWWIY